jgi:2-polyprenyl-3-methyl-5-hydroxy-6-metoxy-1,4-benzoquinol methylase
VNTESDEYAQRLQKREGVWWKRLLNVQAPYQWNLRRQHLGRTLDVGCGIGRNLSTLTTGSVGVDHNAASIAVARERGLAAFTTAEWATSALRQEPSFDAILLAHVIEHMPADAAQSLLRHYLPCLKPGGKVFFICPQERGFASDSTHIRFTDGEDLVELAVSVGLVPRPWFSFPLPRWAGRLFVYNEFCLLATKPPVGLQS